MAGDARQRVREILVEAGKESKAVLCWQTTKVFVVALALDVDGEKHVLGLWIEQLA
jgi:hypothetical protein